MHEWMQCMNEWKNEWMHACMHVWNEMKWNAWMNEVKWHEVKCYEMKWNEIEWNGITKWNEMEWNRMKWNEIEWNGMCGYKSESTYKISWMLAELTWDLVWSSPHIASQVYPRFDLGDQLLTAAISKLLRLFKTKKKIENFENSEKFSKSF